MNDVLHQNIIGQSEEFAVDKASLLYQFITTIEKWRPSSGRSKNTKLVWHTFLDDLCWLCDTESGGSTTTSIAAEDISGMTQFWIVAKKRVKDKALAHLRMALSELQRLAFDSDVSGVEVGARIYEASIFISHEKVGDYIRRLRMYLDMAPRAAPLSLEGWRNSTSL
nr:hypothetical protein CFP56_39025 [Quercus suber]